MRISIRRWSWRVKAEFCSNPGSLEAEGLGGAVSIKNLVLFRGTDILGVINQLFVAEFLPRPVCDIISHKKL